MSKDRSVRSFNIREADAEWLDNRDNVNGSGVVRALLREYITLGKVPEASQSVRMSEIDADIKQKREKIARLESEIDELQRERENIRDRLTHRERERESAVTEVAKLFESGRVPRDQLSGESDVITAKASGLDITASQLAERVRAELEGSA